MKVSFQLAAAGKWESAVSAYLFTGHWCDVSGNDIAIEAVYTDASEELAGFIGFRKVIDDPQERQWFWQATVQEATSTKRASPSEQFARWLDVLKSSPVSDLPPSHVELGVFNLWKSAGTIVQNSENLALLDTSEGPDWLMAGADAPICQEFVWDVADGIWVADVVSERRDCRYFLITTETISEDLRTKSGEHSQ